MAESYRHLLVVRHGNVACVRLAKPRMDENEIHELALELIHLAREGGCPRIALSLGPQTPECLYSVFLSKLISLHPASANWAAASNCASVRRRWWISSMPVCCWATSIWWPTRRPPWPSGASGLVPTARPLQNGFPFERLQ